MAEQSMLDLEYGHLGPILYNPDEQGWSWPRNIDTAPALLPLGPPQLIFTPRNACSLEPQSRLDRQISSLIQSQPHLAPAAHLLAEPAAISHEIEKAVVHCDPTFGRLLAFGRLHHVTSRRSVPVAAFPAPDQPHVLCLVQLQLQRHGWQHDKTVWIDLPRMTDDKTTWQAPAPIRQISFAQPEEGSTTTHTLALRTLLGVNILRIAARKSPTTRDSHVTTSARFHITALCSLTTELSGGFAPAHVTFNHWYPKQFMTIDQQGTWRVWDATIRLGKPTELCRGATNDHAVPDEQATATLTDDGWGQATWAGNAQTIVVATRKCLAIYDVQGKPVRLHSPNLAIAGTPHWILDVLLNPVDPSLVFVLTSVSLFCIRVRCLDEFDPDSLSTAGANVLLQCRHYRDPEDISLSLSNHVEDEDLTILIKSSLSPHATSYRFTPSQFSAADLTVTDPALIILPTSSSKSSVSSSLRAFELQSVEFGESGLHGMLSGPGEMYRDLSIRFYMATVITNDASVAQQLYYALPSSIKASDPTFSVQPLHWRGKLIQSRPLLQDSGLVDESAAFGELLGNDKREPGNIRPPNPDLARGNWTRLYRLAHARSTAAASEPEDFSDILVRIRQAIDDDKSDAAGHKLLSELCDRPILVPDIDEIEAEFKHLATSTRQSDDMTGESEHALLLTEIANRPALDVGSINSMTPTGFYDDMISNWLTPLSQNVPGRVRLAKEQLARRIAAQLCLASHVIRQPLSEPVEEETQPVSQLPTSSQMSFPQSSLPTPSPTATPSVTTAGSLSSHPSTLVSPEFARLQRYASIAPDNPTPAPLPKSLSNALGHWTLGDNPDEYDWLTVQREQERRAEEENDDLTPRERARLKRRAERLLLKQRHESQKASAINLASSQAPVILSASQPAVATAPRSGSHSVPQPAIGAASQGTQLLASSQSQAQPNMFSSQVQPGRSGGKPTKKKRKIGF